LVANIKANYDIVPTIKMDMDYEEKEMTTEQKEVFQCLQNEKENVIYDDLEDDFVMMAKGDDNITNNQKSVKIKEENEDKNIMKEKEMADLYKDLDEFEEEEEEDLEEFE
jgi:hypothetical protein